MLSLQISWTIHALTISRPLHPKNLIPDFQSAYCKNYSMDLLWWYENQNITSTVILDLSTAFDTIHNDILLTILHNHFGIKDMALNWFKNYLRPWFFKVAVDGKHSSPRELKYGVPQWSCSGGHLFTCYCWLIEDKVDNSITLTAFADDHSICNNFKAGDKEQEHKVKTDLEKTFTHLKQWMDMMHLKLNPDKTEYILFGSWEQLKKTSQEPLNAQGDLIAVSKVVRYLGGFLDQNLNFKKHIKEKTKKAMANITKTHAIQKYLKVQSCTTLVLMLCITYFDYANAMLFGLPSSTLRKYQTICAKHVLVNSLFKVLSNFPSWYLFSIRLMPNLALDVLHIIMGTEETALASYTTKDRT